MLKRSLISIVIPTFNEKGNVVRLIKKLKKTAFKNKMRAEIIIIDDNSPDGTADAVRHAFSKDKNVGLWVRKGKRDLAQAILYGINESRGNVIVCMDADFNHDPDVIPALINRLKKADLVIASRFIDGGGMDDKKRYFFTLIFNLFLKNIFTFPSTDNTSGFYAIRKRTLLDLPLSQIYKGYGEYHLRFVYLAKKRGLTIQEVPVYYKKRIYGQSKSKLLLMFFKYLWVSLSITLQNVF